MCNILQDLVLHIFNFYLFISRSKTTIWERAASALERYVCLTTFNEDDCVLSVCDLLSVSFVAVCASACWRDAQLLVRGNACCISAVISECHIAYNTVSHVYYFYILGGVKFTYVVSTIRCIYTCPVSSGMTWSGSGLRRAIGFILQNAWSDQV